MSVKIVFGISSFIIAILASPDTFSGWGTPTSYRKEQIAWAIMQLIEKKCSLEWRDS